ncbi:MAG: molybdopterin molybdenumtransferase MoeA, partial [Erythrobacter sp.]
MSLMDLEEAQERLLALAPSLTTERVPVERARNRVLAADLTANRTQPDADLSAMDGYAIVGDGPWRRIGESRAGKPFEGRLDTGEAVRISTGAALPQGADRVLIQENAQIESSAEGDRIAASETPAAGQHVRLRGFDFTAGATVLEKGALLGPAQIALALAAGHGSLEVKCRPRMAVLDSGDELASDPEKCGPAQIPA